MHFSTLLPTLLLTLPSVLAKDCTHYEINYYINGKSKLSCPFSNQIDNANNAPDLGSLDSYKDAFDKNRDNFKAWADKGPGGFCGAWCNSKDRTTTFNAKSGTTQHTMRCVAPRMRKDGGRMPDGVNGIFVGTANRYVYSCWSRPWSLSENTVAHCEEQGL